eukprot:5128443-Amphidinium_carterae.1
MNTLSSVSSRMNTSCCGSGGSNLRAHLVIAVPLVSQDGMNVVLQARSRTDVSNLRSVLQARRWMQQRLVLRALMAKTCSETSRKLCH